MKNSKHVLILMIILTAVASGIIIYIKFNQANNFFSPPEEAQDIQTQKPSEFSASFAIYTNGTFRIFTNSMYHDLSPDVYISGKNPNVVNVKKEGITWGDFFSTLPFELNNQCLTTGTNQTFCSNETYTLQFYLNENLTEDIMENEINPGDKLLITFDTPNSSNLSEQLRSVPEPN